MIKECNAKFTPQSEFKRKRPPVLFSLNEINTRGLLNFLTNEEINFASVNVDCKTILDVQKDFAEEVDLSFTDTLGSMQDRGLMVMIKELLGIDNAYDFLVKMGVETDG